VADNSSLKVWVCGEVLIDLIPDLGDSGKPKAAIVGGGPANTATALAKFGLDSRFIDGISTSDSYGQLAKDYLLAAGVDLSLAHFVAKPTCTADVSLDDEGKASYIFTIDDTATFDFSLDWLPKVDLPNVLHIGTLVTIVESSRDVLFQWAKKIGERTPIIFDPNIRPSVQPNREIYRSEVEKWVSLASVVKVSDDDLKWLYPEKTLSEVANDWLAKNLALLVITKGSEGLSAFQYAGDNLNKDEINKAKREIQEHSVPGVKVNVVDTVGAGDTVGAVLAMYLAQDAKFYQDQNKLREALSISAAAAAITCSRAGANTPTILELNNLIGK
jgi:fructokinase